jgi:uncharacterized protein YjiS (DUF1127 family)
MSRVSQRLLISICPWFLIHRIRVILRAEQLRRRRRLAARALAALSDHTLKDMGLSRGAIHELVHCTRADRPREVHDDVAL